MGPPANSSHSHHGDEQGRPQGEHHHHDERGHSHVHGLVDPAIATSERGVWAVKWSFVGLMLTAVLQAAVVVMSGSVALLADTIHNVGDAATAIPLWIAFLLSKRRPTERFSFGLGRVEDIAGVAVIAAILASGLVAAYESIDRILAPQPVTLVGAVAIAAVIGFIGNEGVARFRIRVGREIASAALIADGYHARTDGFTSLAVLVGVIGVAAGFPLADPLVGLAIAAVILLIGWQSAKAIFVRILDGVDPEVIEDVRHSASHVAGVRDVTDVRARWIGHRLAIEANVAVDPTLSVAAGHAIASEVRHQLLHELSSLSLVAIHIDSSEDPGEAHHHVAGHTHDDLPLHSH
jgi:cation diffusion facilitator family transporter